MSLSLSIRNQLPGTVTAVSLGAAVAVVTVRLDGGQAITSAITREAVQELDLIPGRTVRALVKATDVSLAAGPVTGLSIRNHLPGTVAQITADVAMAAVKVTVPGGELTAAVTKEAVDDLGLSAGSAVTVLIKATEVALAATG